MMAPWTLIVSSYALTVVATFGLTAWSWRAMRRAEAEAARLGNRP